MTVTLIQQKKWNTLPEAVAGIMARHEFEGGERLQTLVRVCISTQPQIFVKWMSMTNNELLEKSFTLSECRIWGQMDVEL